MRSRIAITAVAASALFAAVYMATRPARSPVLCVHDEPHMLVVLKSNRDDVVFSDQGRIVRVRRDGPLGAMLPRY